MTDIILEDPGCLSLPKELVDSRDFKAEQAIEVDYTTELPKSFSLGKRIYKTNYQGAIGSCTSNSTSHGVQVLVVKKNGVVPTTKNIMTPNRKDLRTKMGHNPEKYEGGDYMERAVSIALKQGIETEEGGEARFDAYATQEWHSNDESIELIKRYLYQGCPILRLLKGNRQTRNELSAGELKTIPENTTGSHAIACVGWDEGGLRFINSRKANDVNKLKSRFYISNRILKQLGRRINFRYRVLYIKEDAKLDPEYLKKKNYALVVLKSLKTVYPTESSEVKLGIEALSKAYRKAYPELNDELPINS